MSWMDDLAAAMAAAIPAPADVIKIGTMDTSSGSVLVAWDGGASVPVSWSSAFDLVLSTKGIGGVNGLKVMLLIKDGQPWIDDLIITGS
jgi:hypothetical protein